MFNSESKLRKLEEEEKALRERLLEQLNRKQLNSEREKELREELTGLRAAFAQRKRDLLFQLP